MDAWGSACPRSAGENRAEDSAGTLPVVGWYTRSRCDCEETERGHARGLLAWEVNDRRTFGSFGVRSYFLMAAFSYACYLTCRHVNAARE